ncbi:multi antimicrobial extrusion protein MatE [Paenibacillus contaminans]|uniref:Multi antimicrobial extrusion protein MatE n=1 Tax=Paenibacillus contaminans TaxID=450362 RepID=A0A329LKP3_9BACL|nr:multi antimicrobial extrusion protein MatE [Paenibacillus contaminans]RAV08329.1 multi antimicrobial extrusion protein MatE [Paenibacillus contaminans]
MATDSNNTQSPTDERAVSYPKLFAFFIPLGLSASLVTISHVIINSTLARSAQPELIIASYAVAMSLIGLAERPAVLLRQTCSALVRDRRSFRAMSAIAWYVFLCIFAYGILISYTPIGNWVFANFFGVEDEQLSAVIDVYRILMYVSIFSGLRCLYHGLIIYNRRTTWLTIGMVIRLLVMYAIAQYYLMTDQVTSGRVGAVIFLAGMMIECLVSVLEGRSLLRKKIPEELEEHPVKRQRDVFSFYRPLLYSSFIAVIIGPSITAVLGKTDQMELSIASFAIAGSLTQLVQSFFSYIHQIVLNFYRIDQTRVFRFTLFMAFIPTLLIGLLSYTPAGPLFLQHVMGVNEQLLHASLQTLRIFMIMTLLFPWLDYCNGILMLKGQTKVMVWSQAANVTVTVSTLLICITATPGWNAMIGALAQSLGFAGELAVVLVLLRHMSDDATRIGPFKRRESAGA